MDNTRGTATRLAVCMLALAGMAACAPPPLPALNLPGAPLLDQGPAPELTNGVWLNSDKPLRLAELRGRVVLIDMWTFG